MNDFRRLALLSLLFVISMMLWNAWTAEHAPLIEPDPVVSTSTTPGITQTTTTRSDNNSVPVGIIKNQYIHINNNVMDIKIDRAGGNIVKTTLLKYSTSIHNKKPITLLNNNPDTYYVATSGVIATTLPSPDTLVYQASINNTKNQVILTSHTRTGIIITKTYSFLPDDYLIHVTQSITNHSGTILQGRFFNTLDRKPVVATGVGPFNFNTYLGGAISTPQKRYAKLTFKEMDEKNLDHVTQNGWLAMIQHYFLSAWVPDATENYHYYSQKNSDIYTLGMRSPRFTLEPNQTIQNQAKLYIGPEISHNLIKVAPGLNLTIDYGILWFIAIMIFSVMQKIYGITGNWGWAIILVTLLIKIIFYKLNSISFRSMANMRELQPRIEEIRKNCGDDKQKLAKATMELYKREKINPLGGCLPLLVQIPVFLSLYWVIMESVQLRQAPFILWIHDLSVKDPYYILPLLMGLTIFIQQWFAPKPPDPMQRKIMLFMPVIFTALFLSFPAGLVLYWVANNTLSILQQWYIMNHVVPRSKKKKKK